MSDDEEFARRLAETKARRDRDRRARPGPGHRAPGHRPSGSRSCPASTAGLLSWPGRRTAGLRRSPRRNGRPPREDLEGALTGKGAAEAAEQQARGLLDAAESGQDLASAQLRVLAQAGLPAAALLDVVDLDDAQRPVWEPGLALYRDAVVVHRDQGPRARGLLAGLPGSTLILADEPGPDAAKPTALPASADPRFDLAVFLTAIGRRADGRRGDDGRGGRRHRARRLSRPDHRPGRSHRRRPPRPRGPGRAPERGRGPGLSAARKTLKRAEERARAADAAEQASTVSEEISRLRKENMARLEQRESLRPELLAADDEYAKALGAAHARDQTLANLRGSAFRSARQPASDRGREDKTNRRTRRNEPDRAPSRLGRKRRRRPPAPPRPRRRPATAHHRRVERGGVPGYSTMPSGSASRTVPRRRKCPPRSASFSSSNAGSAADWTSGSGSLPALLRALRTHLNLTEQHDSYQQTQIAAQRAERTADLAAARTGGWPRPGRPARRTGRRWRWASRPRSSRSR